MKKIMKFLGIAFIVAMIIGAIANSETGSKLLNDVGIPIGRQLPSVPDELKENIFLDSRELGGCEKLEGDVLVMFIFIDDAISRWTPEGISQAMADYNTQAEALATAAGEYGITLDIQTRYTTVKSSEILLRNSYKDWADSVFELAGLKSRAYFDDELEEDYSVSQATGFLCLNKGGRAFAVSSNAENVSEYGVLFNDSGSFAHELCHIFGAADFYYPEQVVTASETYLGESIMKDPSNITLDGLSAYLVGWTDELSEDSISFLRETNFLTPELYNSYHKEETYTGYVTDKEMDGGTYTGYLVDGFKHGQGTYTSAEGDVYTGNWSNGRRYGQGTYTWANGDSFTGLWGENSAILNGTFTWASGNVYVGGFVEGKMSGYGTYTWANGDRYEGDFVEGERTGQGAFVWANGDSYVGGFAAGKLSGYGKMTWTNGNYYEGNYVDSQRSGQGTFVWATGGSYSGEWVAGERSGYGTYTWANGDVYVGGFLNGKLHGQGTITYANGRTSTGTWNNGERVG